MQNASENFDRDYLTKKIPTGPSENMQLWME